MLRNLLLIFLIGFCIDLFAQDKENEQLRASQQTRVKNRIDMKINIPAGFKEVKNPEIPNDASAVDYAFVNKDSTIFITIGLQPRDSLIYERSKKSFKMFMPQFPNYEPDDQWKLNFKGRVDSSDFKPQMFAASRLRAFNADAGAEYKIKYISELYMNRYVPERVISLNKKFKGIAEIYFFKAPGTKSDINRQLKKAYRMIKYN